MTNPRTPTPRRFSGSGLRFSIAGLLGLMLIATVAASGASYLWAAMNGKKLGMMVFFPFVLIVPFAVTIAVYWLRRSLGSQEAGDEDQTHFLG